MGKGAKSIDVALKMAEQQVERELDLRLSQKMRASSQDGGSVDSLRNRVASHVAGEAYDRAIQSLEEYISSKREYPQFKDRADRYVTHASDLIHAIKAKRSFPGMQHLSMSKQQELYDRAMEHFDELKSALKRIEQIEQEVRIEDVRSTVWVIQALIYSTFAVLVMAFLLELSKGILPSAIIVADDAFGRMVNWCFDLIGI